MVTFIVENDTPETVRDRVQKLEQECFVECLQKVIDGSLLIGPDAPYV